LKKSKDQKRKERRKKGKRKEQSGMERKIMSYEKYYGVMIFVHFGQQKEVDLDEIGCENCYDFKNKVCSGKGLNGVLAVDFCINELTKDRRGELESHINKETGKMFEVLRHESIDEIPHVHIWGNDYEGIEDLKIIAEKECGMQIHEDSNKGLWKDAPVC
jgi:hypothetical protein